MAAEFSEVLEELLDGGTKTAEVVVKLSENFTKLQESVLKLAEFNLELVRRVKVLEENAARANRPNTNTLYGLPLKG